MHLIEMDDTKSFKENVYDYERVLLEDYLSRTNDIHELSEKTGLELSTLRKKAKRLGIDMSFGGEK